MNGMNIKKIVDILNEEKPLDNLVVDGGFTCIFPTIACIGDSLSSGEFEYYVDESKPRQYIDKFEFYYIRVLNSFCYGGQYYS